MPRRNRQSMQHERRHTVGGRFTRVRPTPAMILWLERHERYLKSRYLGKPPSVLESQVPAHELLPINANELADLSWLQEVAKRGI